MDENDQTNQGGIPPGADSKKLDKLEDDLSKLEERAQDELAKGAQPQPEPIVSETTQPDNQPSVDQPPQPQGQPPQPPEPQQPEEQPELSPEGKKSPVLGIAIALLVLSLVAAGAYFLGTLANKESEATPSPVATPTVTVSPTVTPTFPPSPEPTLEATPSASPTSSPSASPTASPSAGI